MKREDFETSEDYRLALWKVYDENETFPCPGECGEVILYNGKDTHVRVCCVIHNSDKCEITKVQRYTENAKVGDPAYIEENILSELSSELIKDLEERMLGHFQD